MERQPQQEGCKADLKVEAARKIPHYLKPTKPRGWHTWLIMVAVGHSNTILTAVIIGYIMKI